MGKGRFRTPFRLKGIEAPFGASLRALMPPAAIGHRPLPLALGEGSFGALAASSFHRPQSLLVGGWPISPLTWTFHLCGLRQYLSPLPEPACPAVTWVLKERSKVWPPRGQSKSMHGFLNSSPLPYITTPQDPCPSLQLP